MNISSITAATARSTENIGNLLKDISARFQEKLIKVNVAEELADDNLGQNIDMIA